MKNKKESMNLYWDETKWKYLTEELFSSNQLMVIRKKLPASWEELSGSEFEIAMQWFAARFFQNMFNAGEKVIAELSAGLPKIPLPQGTQHRWGNSKDDFELVKQMYLKSQKTNELNSTQSPLLIGKKTFYRWKNKGSYPSEELLNFLVLSLDIRYRNWNLYGINPDEIGLILVRELSGSQGQEIPVNVMFNDHSYRVIIDDPVSAQEREDLEWYFDDYIYETYVAQSKAKNCEEVIRRVGKDLFSKLFCPNGEDLFAPFLQLVGGFSNIRIEFHAITNRFDRINWEWLLIPGTSHPLMAKGVVIYRKFPANDAYRLDNIRSPTLNILMITSRPFLEKDVRYNTIQKPLVEALKNGFFISDGKEYEIRVDIIRPGTYLSLVEHLSSNQRKYHVLHLDMHGIVSDYDGLLKKRDDEGIYNFRAFRSFSPGEAVLDEIEPFEGMESFLLFEQETTGIADVVKAVEFAEMISSSGIPVCVIGACQSALQNSEEEEVNLAKFVCNRGVDLVVAMKHSVSVDAARIFCANLYDEMRKDQSLERSLNKARIALLRKKKRSGRFGVEVRIDDWTIPIIYRNRKVDFRLDKNADELFKRSSLLSERRNVFDQEQFGGTFVDRDIDIMRIERALLSRGPDGKFKTRLGINGMLGEGKSTLFKYLSWWWEETNFARHVIYFSFKTRTWTFLEIMHAVLNKLSLPSASSGDGLLGRINAEKVIFIFDDLDPLKDDEYGWASVSEADQKKIIDFLKGISQLPETGGRSPSQTIMIARHFQFFPLDFIHTNQILNMEGLGELEAYRLAKSILGLNEQEWKKLTDNTSFQRYMNFMHGNPGAIRQFIPVLKRETPETALNNLLS